MKNVFVYLVGPPGVGKFTIGSILAERMPAKLVDNHYWLNPIFGLVEQDGLTPLPSQIWNSVRQVRHAILDTIANLSPRDWNFVATHAAVGGAEDQIIAEEILAAAERRHAMVLVASLACSPEELARRVTAPGRRERLKDVDAATARNNAMLPPFRPGRGHPALVIDTSAQTPDGVAERILGKLKEMENRS